MRFRSFSALLLVVLAGLLSTLALAGLGLELGGGGSG